MGPQGVSFQAKSSNRKLSPIEEVPLGSGKKRQVPQGPFCSSTYVSISATCPESCIYRDNGCYVQGGQSGWVMRRLDRQAAHLTGLEVTTAEAALIDKQFIKGVPQDGARGGRDLRLHVGGDVSCQLGVQRLAQAARRWQSRGGGRVWTYTHRWREVSPFAWGLISVLASVETTEQAFDAIEKGYVPAITVDRFLKHRAHVREGLKIVPCPAQTKGRTCAECRLCLEDNLPPGKKVAVAFALHGQKQNRAREARFRLKVLPLPGFEAHLE